MGKLKCDGREITVDDFLIEKRICNFDIKFEGEKDFEDFLSFYEDHVYGKGIFTFEIDDKTFQGWFGQILYDMNYNVRLYAGIYDEDYEIENEEGGKVYTIAKSVIGVNNALNKLCEILHKKGVIEENQKDEILAELDCPKSVLDFKSLVRDLPLYLQSRNETMSELRGKIQI